MSWIDTVEYAQADSRLRKMYDRVKSPDGQIDNILLAHGLRPHTLEGHMALYKAALHHRANTLSDWFLEAIGVYVSELNACAYCVRHHVAGLARVLQDSPRAAAMHEAMRSGDLASTFNASEVVALTYAAKLTRTPAQMSAQDAEALRGAGYDDGQILEINQVSAYFAYANRTVLGLGVSPEGETLGMAPRNQGDGEDWGHG